MAVRGHLDGLEGAYLVGWAEAGADHCCITVQTAQGEIVAEGTASNDRPDLAALGIGRTNIAFRIPVPAMAERSWLHVFANDTELFNSPIEVGPGLFNGHVNVFHGIAVGWVSERIIGSAPPRVRILDQDGRVVGEAQSALGKSSADPLFAPAHFQVELDPSCFGRGELRLRAQVGDFTFAQCNCTLALEACLDQVTAEHVTGWMFSPSAPQRIFALDVFRNGELLGCTRCEQPRFDVKARFPASQNPGFAYSLKAIPWSQLDFATISLRFPGSDVELFDGPYIVGSRPAAVQAARRLARLSLEVDERFSPAERSVMHMAMADFLDRTRAGSGYMARRQISSPATEAPRLNIIIPIYKGIEATRACIESVIAHWQPARDRIVLVNDGSPEPGMASMLAVFVGVPNLFILTNETNLGFVKTVNHGLSFCQAGDVLLLNSDTRVFHGGLDEMWQVAHSAETIGCVTAISNNATIFSYPHVTLRCATLEDIGWEELAEIALADNAGMAIDVPTGHGFCLLIKRQVLQRVGVLDESFGRGYGEENDFCARAADLGYRNVAAPGALVEHLESVSFGEDKAALLALNVPRLEAMYPEYSPIIMEAERRDDMRRGRWALDAARLHAAGQRGESFALIIQHSMGGGTNTAIEDIEQVVGYGGAIRLTLSCRADGTMELSCAAPAILAVFAANEVEILFQILSEASPRLVLIHQLLGYSADFVRHLTRWAADTHSVFYAHDFYAFCPRVTMIDSAGQFCRLGSVEVCTRCLKMGGSHEASQLQALTPPQHRQLFEQLLAACSHVVAPSQDAAGYLRRAFPKLKIQAIPHPERPGKFPNAPRGGTDDEVVLLGAIGPHKGSAKLLEIAQRALLSHPHLQFRVIGYTDIDSQLMALGNVTITGKYQPSERDQLCAEARGRLALFLSAWPETYSYTLSEAVSLGFIPLVPDLGALAERVKAQGFGVVFPFPIDAVGVLELISGIARGDVAPMVEGASPVGYQTSEEVIAMSRKILSPRRRHHAGARPRAAHPD